MDGTELRLLREARGLTQVQLASALRITSNTLARWERSELPVPAHVPLLLEAVVGMGSAPAAVRRPGGIPLDPHHGKILESLDRHLDSEVFEACAVALLMEAGYSVAPVRGGQDDGFDGAVARGNGEPYPLIVTTAQDPHRNLKRSLVQAQCKGWMVDQALFATSRRVTPPMRLKLFETARSLGVTLVQTFDQDWFAQRLYQSPHWCKRLLGLTGRPRSLSVYPVTQRPSLRDKVIGREREMQWLMGQRSDCLLVGGPGSGKTSLLQLLVLQSQALFLVDPDREQLANDLRELRPPAVIIDDAHVDPGTIHTVTQLRQQVDAGDVRIIATTWPGQADGIRSALQLADKDVLDLQLLDADTMVEIIKSFGIEGPRELIALIRQQADGRPGLAATLADLYLKGDVRRVTSGEALVAQLASQLNGALPSDVKGLLAPFALSGEAGAKPASAVELLRTPEPEANSKLASLASAGIIRDRANGALSVEPPPMRWALVRDVFFGGGPLDYARYIDIAENPNDAIETLIGAVSRGASIPDLPDLIESTASNRLWSKYASLGPSQTEYVLDYHPELIPDIAQAGLIHVPEKTIPLLLDRAREGDLFHHNGPIEELRSWAEHAHPLRADVLSRRSMLVKAAASWWQRTGRTTTAIRAMCIALTPGFHHGALDPGAGKTLTITDGVLPSHLLQGMIPLWATLVELITKSVEAPWNALLQLVTDWWYGVTDGDLSPEYRVLMREFAVGMLRDLADVTSEHPGIQHRLRKQAERMELTVHLNLDPAFEAFYPDGPLDPEEEAKLADAVSAEWRIRPVEKIAESILRIETEARLADIHPGVSQVPQVVCARLAEAVTDPVSAAEVFMQYGIGGNLVEPFIRRATAEHSPTGRALLKRCIYDERYQQTRSLFHPIIVPLLPQTCWLLRSPWRGRLSISSR